MAEKVRIVGWQQDWQGSSTGTYGTSTEKTLLLVSWLSWQDFTKFLLHIGNPGIHGNIRIKILLR